ncbi:MAG: hypothetical protein IPG61_15845 [bacterium]|nr:hypothetical protein [bacterium]
MGYLTVAEDWRRALDWDWLDGQPAAGQGHYTRHLRLAAPLTVLIDGRSRRGIVLRPDAGEGGGGPAETGPGRASESI